MTDLQTNKSTIQEMQVELSFVVNEFPRVRIPPRQIVEQKEYKQMAANQKQMLMERLIDHVKEI